MNSWARGTVTPYVQIWTYPLLLKETMLTLCWLSKGVKEEHAAKPEWASFVHLALERFLFSRDFSTVGNYLWVISRAHFFFQDVQLWMALKSWVAVPVTDGLALWLCLWSPCQQGRCAVIPKWRANTTVACRSWVWKTQTETELESLILM